MQRKRHINFKDFIVSLAGSKISSLHSIPILLNMKKSASQSSSLNSVNNCNYEKNNVKSNVLYSIPCVKSCAYSFCGAKVGVFVVLLLIGIITLLPDMLYSSPSVYATTETFGDSTASMTLDTSDIEVTVAPGETGYVGKDIQLSINNVKDYTLTITAPASLSEQNTTTSQAASWGYAYGQSGELASMSYTNFTGSAQTLESGNTNTTSNKTLALAAKFSDHNTAGHYKANITLALTATPKVAITYSITYNANGGSGTSNPASQSINSYDDTHTFAAAAQGTLAKTGYTFLGWSESSTATTATYAAGSNIILTKASPSKVLYAVWEVKLTLSNITNMQDMTSKICANSALEETKQLKDTRDSKSYWVAKLRDGNCWMTQNLDYDGGGTRITSVDKWYTGNSLGGNVTVTNDMAVYYDPGLMVSDVANKRLVSAGSSDTHLLVGNYYSWPAATNSTGIGLAEGDAPGSICPSGWKLPSGSNDGEFVALRGNLSEAQLQQAPYYMVKASHVSYGSLYPHTWEIVLWSSTTRGSSYPGSAAAFDPWASTVTMVGESRATGANVRCILKAS